MSFTGFKSVDVTTDTSQLARPKTRAEGVIALVGEAVGVTDANTPVYVTNVQEALSYFTSGDLINGVYAAFGQSPAPKGIWLCRSSTTASSVTNELITQVTEGTSTFNLTYSSLETSGFAIKMRKSPQPITSAATKKYIVYMFVGVDSTQNKLIVTLTDYRMNALSNLTIAVTDTSTGVAVTSSSGTSDTEGYWETNITGWEAAATITVACYDPNATQSTTSLCQIQLEFATSPGTPDRAFMWFSEAKSTLLGFAYEAHADNGSAAETRPNATITDSLGNSVTNESLAFGGQVVIVTSWVGQAGTDCSEDFEYQTTYGNILVGDPVNGTDATVIKSTYKDTNGATYRSFDADTTRTMFLGWAQYDGQDNDVSEAQASPVGSVLRFESAVGNISGSYDWADYVNRIGVTSAGAAGSYPIALHVYEGYDAAETSLASLYSVDYDAGSFTMVFAPSYNHSISTDYTVSSIVTAMQSLGDEDFRIIALCGKNDKSSLRAIRSYVSTRPDGRATRGVFMMPKKSDAGGKDITYTKTGSSARMTLVAHDSDDEVAAAVAGAMIGLKPWVQAQAVPILQVENDSKFTSQEQLLFDGSHIVMIGRGVYQPGIGLYTSRGWTLDPSGERETNDVQDYLDWLDYEMKAEFHRPFYYRTIRINREGLKAMKDNAQAILYKYISAGIIESDSTADIPEYTIFTKSASSWSQAERAVIAALKLSKRINLYLSIAYNGQVQNIAIAIEVRSA